MAGYGRSRNRVRASRNVVILGTSPPTLSSVDKDLGDIGGGTTITLTGTNLTGASGVTLGGTACTSVTVVGPTSVTCVTPAKSAGTYDIVITTPGGQATLSSAFEAWSPASLSLTGYWKQTYSAPGSDPRWTGSASAGASNGRVLNRDTDTDPVPTAAAALNGHVGADFERGTGEALQTALAASDYFAVGAGTIAMLVHLESAVAASGGAATDPALVVEVNQKVMLTATNSGIKASINDGALKSTAHVTCATGAYKLVVMKWDGSAVYAGVDGGAYDSAAAGNVSALAGTVILGKQPGVDFTDFRTPLILFANTAISDANRTRLRKWCNDVYALSLS